MTSPHGPIDTLTADAIRLARQGRTADARESLDRAQRGLAPDASAAQRAALTLAHAYCLFFESRLDEAIKTIAQARDLAAAAQSADLEADCDATLALFHTRSGDLTQSVHLARRALARVSDDNAGVQYRAHLALATVMQMAGLPEAFAEYRAAREHARRIQDDMAVAAALHRMAIAQALQARQQFEAGTLSADTARQAIVGLQSSMDMTASVAPAATPVVDGLILAQLHLLSGEIDRADALYARLIPRARAEGHGPVMAHAFAEYALCHAYAGRRDEALALVREALDMERANEEPMMLAILYRAAAATYAELDRPEDFRRYDALARQAWNDFGIMQQRWRDLLRSEPKVD